MTKCSPRFSGPVVIFILILTLALAHIAGDTPIPVAVESAFAGSADDDENHPPVANGEVLEDPDDLWTNMSILFSSVGSYDIDAEDSLNFTWDFDDGTNPSTLANPIHAYEEPGTYNVTLTVIDQSNMVANDTLILTILRNYGDTEIIIKVVDIDIGKTYYDPKQGDLQQVAVMRDGWVAYMCELGKDEVIFVNITIIGDRPADVYLFNKVNFQTYKQDPQVNHVPFEEEGSEQGAIGKVRFTFKARDTDRYYIVIDNKNWPVGTETKGPVDYIITIDPEYVDPGFSDDFSNDFPYGLLIIMATVAIIVVLAVVFVLVAFDKRFEM